MSFYSSGRDGGSGGGGGRGWGGSGNRGGGGGGRGRGAYYRDKYGRGGGRAGNGGHNSGSTGGGPSSPPPSERPDKRSRIHPQQGGGGGGGSWQEFINQLQRIDGKSYAAYHDLECTFDSAGWQHSTGFALYMGRTQSDPFAPPTRCRLVISRHLASLPVNTYNRSKIRRIATADFLLRGLYATCRHFGADQSLRSSSGGGGSWNGPKGGDIRIMEPVQHVLEQSAVQVHDNGCVTVQIAINLPARGRTILGQAAMEIFNVILPRLVQETLIAPALDLVELQHHVDSIEDQKWLQEQLEPSGLVAFIRNGAILPRASGVDNRPMTAVQSNHIVPFQSPSSLQTTFSLPNAGVDITGLGIPTGISLICGGGFHGKSTLLQTLQMGIYHKVPGDGREFCVTVPSAVKIRAEDGRSIQSVDISPFIKNLPFGKDTRNFSTADASGSTSQASSIVESIEMGATVLLIDEDTCATNFMIRDHKMMQLVASDKEPITPFVKVVRSLYEERGISTILVIGGAGDYFDVADHVLLMDSYACHDATERARQIVAAASAAEPNKLIQPSASVPFGSIRLRYPVLNGLQPNGKTKVLNRQSIAYGETDVDLSALEQLVESSAQTTAILAALQTLATSDSMGSCQSGQTLREVLQSLDLLIEQEGLGVLVPPGEFHGSMSRPRIFEISAAINRLRNKCIEAG